MQYSFSYKLFSKYLYIVFFCTISTNAFGQKNHTDTTATSTKEEAILFIESIDSLQESIHWPNINPKSFLQNIKDNIYNPLSMYQGSNTNFCSYAALSWLPLNHDPLGFAKILLELYEKGKVRYGKVKFHPSLSVRKAAGTLQFKGTLDMRPADQMWFFSLADHFTGYLNIFNRRYDIGDENTFWASVNYAKHNRIIRKLFNYKTTTKGTDLIRPSINDLYDYISKKVATGTTMLYINNAFLHKKKHYMLRPGVPTHFIILIDINKTPDGMINITYWDYGFRTLRQITPAFLRKIVFGITHCTKKLPNE